MQLEIARVGFATLKNMSSIVVMAARPQLSIGLLYILLDWNMLAIEVTAPVSQMPISCWKLCTFLNIPSIVVADVIFHPAILPLKPWLFLSNVYE